MTTQATTPPDTTGGIWAGARKAAVVISLLVMIVFTVFIINQVAQVVELADRVNPLFGTIVLWTLIGALTLLVLAPVVMYLRQPRPDRGLRIGETGQGDGTGHRIQGNGNSRQPVQVRAQGR